MNIKDESIGKIVSLNSSSVAGKVLSFHKGPLSTDVDIELDDGSVMNTFQENISEANIIDIAAYSISKKFKSLVA